MAKPYGGKQGMQSLIAGHSTARIGNASRITDSEFTFDARDQFPKGKNWRKKSAQGDRSRSRSKSKPNRRARFSQTMKLDSFVSKGIAQSGARARAKAYETSLRSRVRDMSRNGGAGKSRSRTRTKSRSKSRGRHKHATSRSKGKF